MIGPTGFAGTGRSPAINATHGQVQSDLHALVDPVKKMTIEWKDLPNDGSVTVRTWHRTEKAANTKAKKIPGGEVVHSPANIMSEYDTWHVFTKDTKTERSR